VAYNEKPRQALLLNSTKEKSRKDILKGYKPGGISQDLLGTYQCVLIHHTFSLQ
jgi:hypothetical protein